MYMFELVSFFFLIVDLVYDVPTYISIVWLLNSLFLLFLVIVPSWLHNISSDFAFIEDFSNFVFAFIFLDFRVKKPVGNKLLKDGLIKKAFF